MANDLVTHIPGITNSDIKNPGNNTTVKYKLPFVGLTDGTNPATASKNMAEIYNRLLFAQDALIKESGLTVDQTNWAQAADAVTTIAKNTKKPIVINLSNTTISQTTGSLGATTPGSSYIVLSDTPANDFTSGFGRQHLIADIKFNNFFTKNPDSHFVIGMRVEYLPSVPINTGHAVIFGNLTSNVFGANTFKNKPSAGIESLNNPAAGNKVEVYAQSESPTLSDGVQYRVHAVSTVSPFGNFIRYQLWRLIDNSTAQVGGPFWKLIHDSGDVVEPTGLVKDLTKTKFILAHVFGDTTGQSWSVNLTNSLVVFTDWSDDVTFTNVNSSAVPALVFAGGTNTTLSGTGTTSDPYRYSVTGGETKINQGTNVTITGNGTDASPYVINATGGTAPAVFASGTNTTVSGTGTSANPYKYSIADATEAVKGAVQLAATTNTTSTTLAATPANVASQLSNRVLKTGDTMTGSLNFSGDSLRMGIQSYVGADYTKNFRVQNTNANQGTGFLIIPNGAANAANVTASNTSNLTGAGSYVSMGMNGSTSVINTFGLNGGATPDFQIQRNNTTVATFNSLGMLLSGASVTIGSGTNILNGPFNVGDPNAIQLGNSGLDLGIMSTNQTIRSYLINSHGLTVSQAEGIEIITRPLYAFVSCLIADLRARKVI